MTNKIPRGYTEKSRDKILTRMAYRVIGLLFLGIVFYSFEVSLYRDTIIALHTMACIWLLPSLLATFVSTELWFRFIYSKHFFVRLSGNLIIFCGLSVAFLAVNYSCGDQVSRSYKFKIIQKSSMSSKVGRHWETLPLAYINYFGQRKEIVFSELDAEKVKNTDSLNITVHKGALGFDVIDEIYFINSEKKENTENGKINSTIPKWNNK